MYSERGRVRIGPFRFFLNKRQLLSGRPWAFLTSIAPLIPEYTISSCCMQLCFLLKAHTIKCSLFKHRSLHFNVTQFSEYYTSSGSLPNNKYAVTKVTEGFHLYNEHILLKIFGIFFLSIWTPCLVPLFIMLPVEYWVRYFCHWKCIQGFTVTCSI